MLRGSGAQLCELSEGRPTSTMVTRTAWVVSGAGVGEELLKPLYELFETAVCFQILIQ